MALSFLSITFWFNLTALSKEKSGVTEGEVADGLIDTRPQQARSGGLRKSEDAHLTDL